MTVQYDKLIDIERLGAFKGKCDDEYAEASHTHSYAGSPGAGGNANKSNAILYGIVDGTSTSTAFTATVAGLTAYTDGTTVMLKNGVVTSAAGFTVNINGIGAKPVYSNMAAATADTTIFNVNYTMLFVYDSTRVEGGAWICYRGYNSDNNTIGYQLRTNSTAMPAITRTRYYRLLFTSADGTKWVPANTGYDNSATSKKTVNQNAIDPFGRIVYMSGTTNVPAGSNVGATVCWSRYALNLGYSFNPAGGAAIVLTYPAPVYVKCAPQTNGSAIMDSTTPYVQALPSTNDGKIYILLGMAYSETNIELYDVHPVYWHDGTGIRVWTGASSMTPASHSHGNITNGGDITATAPTVVSGDKLIINDESASKVTNGPSFGSSTTTFLANNGTWQTPAGSYSLPTASTSQLGGVKVDGSTITIDNNGVISSSGGGGGGVSYITTTCTLPTTGWSNNSITVGAAGVTASNDVIVSPAPSSASEWASCGIVCTGQGSGTLTFTRTSANTNALTANLMVWTGGTAVLFAMSGTLDSSARISAPTSWVPTDMARYSVHVEITGSYSETYDGMADGFVNGDNIWLYFYDSSQGGLIPDTYVAFNNGIASYQGRTPTVGCDFELTVYG